MSSSMSEQEGNERVEEMAHVRDAQSCIVRLSHCRFLPEPRSSSCCHSLREVVCHSERFVNRRDFCYLYRLLFR